MPVTAVIFHDPPRTSSVAGVLSVGGGQWGWSVRDDADPDALAEFEAWVSAHSTTVTVGAVGRVRRWGRIAGGANLGVAGVVSDVFDTLAGHVSAPLDPTAVRTAIGLTDAAFAEIAAPAVELVGANGAHLWGDVALAANATIAEGDVDAVVATPDGGVGADLDGGLVRFVRAQRRSDRTWVLSRPDGTTTTGSGDLDVVLDGLAPDGTLVARTVTVRAAFADISDQLRSAARVADGWGHPILIRGVDAAFN